MSESYLGFANSSLGSRLARLLGLPQPLPLERYQAGAPVIQGAVLVGAAGNPELLPALALCFQAMGATTVAHSSVAAQWVIHANATGMMSGRWGVADQAGEKVKALVLDATGLADSRSRLRSHNMPTPPRAALAPGMPTSFSSVAQ